MNCAGYNYKYTDKLSHITDSNTVRRLKPGDPLYPTKDLAIFTSQFGIVLEKLDNEPLNITSDMPVHFLVLPPGKHSLIVKYKTREMSSQVNQKVEFEAKPNQTIFICANVDGSKWKPDAKIIDRFVTDINADNPCPIPFR